MKYEIILFDADETLYDFKNPKKKHLKIQCLNLI